MNLIIYAIWLIFLVSMGVYIFWKRQDWYLFLIPLFIITAMYIGLSFISIWLSNIFAVIVIGYIIYGFTNKRARKLRRDIAREKEILKKEYKKELVDNQLTFKDFSLPSGKKIDYIDFREKRIYFLKPYSNNCNKQYKKTMSQYIAELEKVYGGIWTYYIDTFD